MKSLKHLLLLAVQKLNTNKDSVSQDWPLSQACPRFIPQHCSQYNRLCTTLSSRAARASRKGNSVRGAASFPGPSKPLGGARRFHRKSTLFTKIHSRALCGANLVTQHPRFWDRHIHTYIFEYVQFYMYMYIHIYIHTYIYIHIYLYIYRLVRGRPARHLLGK